MAPTPADEADVAPLPPWLWLWYGYAAIHAPAIFAGIRDYVGQLTGDGLPEGLAGTPSQRPIQLMAAAHLVPSFIFLAGLLAVLLPGVRTALVERRWRLRPSKSPAVREMAAFVARRAPGVAVTANLLRSDRIARVYPAGWRRARIAVFAPLVKLWRSPDPADRALAEAALRHELGHVRAGDHLIVGLGSPFVFLLKAWAVSFVCLAAAPMIVFALQPHRATVVLLGQLVLLFAQPAQILLLPVVGLWLAELGADRYAAATGDAGFLSATPTRSVRRWPSLRAYAGLLSHPPRRLRRRLLRPDAPLWPLLAAFPLAVVVDLALTLAAAVPAWRLVGRTWPQTWDLAAVSVRSFLLDQAALWIASVLLVALWPWVSRWWVRLSTGRPSSAPRPAARTFAVAAVVPAALVAVALLTGLTHPVAPSSSVDPVSRTVVYPLRATGERVGCVGSGPAAQTVPAWLDRAVWTLHGDGTFALDVPDAPPGLFPVSGTFLRTDAGLRLSLSIVDTDPAGVRLLQVTGVLDPFVTPGSAALAWRSLGAYSGPTGGTTEAVLDCVVTLTIP